MATKRTTGRAADQQMKKMERDAKAGKGTLSYTPKKSKPAKRK